MVQRFPNSRWLEEALYSGGNMYLIKHDPEQAIYHYTLLMRLFPDSTYAPSSHWRAAWMNYRQRHYPEAARLMDEQIQRYPGGIEIPSALYWRGRIYEDEEKNFSQAVNYYRTLSTTYINFYYGELARQRLTVLGTQPAVAPAPALGYCAEDCGAGADRRAAGERAAPDQGAAAGERFSERIHRAGDTGEPRTAAEWGALAQAEIYVSFGEYTRALQSMKHSGISFFALPMDQVPVIYWHLLFPQPYWSEIVSELAEERTGPYLVASLIRQESEFNAGAVSRANAYGLMQLLPSVGKSLAKKQGIKHFNANDAAESGDQCAAGNDQSEAGAGPVRRAGGVCAGGVQRRGCAGTAVDGVRRLQGRSRVCRVDSLHGDARVRAGDPAQPGDVPSLIPRPLRFLVLHRGVH